MSDQKESQHGAEPPAVNEVLLVGRVAAVPERREMPSGDVVWLVRVVVRRDALAVRTRQRVDTIDCAVWLPRLHRSVATWRGNDVVEVRGALRRRFFCSGAGAASRVEVEVGRARVVRRAATD